MQAGDPWSNNTVGDEGAVPDHDDHVVFIGRNDGRVASPIDSVNFITVCRDFGICNIDVDFAVTTSSAIAPSLNTVGFEPLGVDLCIVHNYSYISLADTQINGLDADGRTAFGVDGGAAL